MSIARIYLDTSVLGGYFDKEFSEATMEMFAAFHDAKLKPLVSSTLVDEVEKAPVRVRELLNQLLDMGAERLEALPECFELQEAYLMAGVIGRNYADDALHVSQATVSKADAIASWNFRHLVRPERIRGYNLVNRKHGFDPVIILTPIDLVRSLEENEDANS